MKKWSHVLSAAILTVGICLGYGQEAQAMVGGKPVIGISWKSPKQAKSYEAFKKIITMAGGIPVELDQIKSTDVTYAADGTVDKAYVEPSGMLKQAYADKIRQDGFERTNIQTVMQGIDGVFERVGKTSAPPCTKYQRQKKITVKQSMRPGIFLTTHCRITAAVMTFPFLTYAAANR